MAQPRHGGPAGGGRARGGRRDAEFGSRRAAARGATQCRGTAASVNVGDTRGVARARLGPCRSTDCAAYGNGSSKRLIFGQARHNALHHEHGRPPVVELLCQACACRELLSISVAAMSVHGRSRSRPSSFAFAKMTASEHRRAGIPATRLPGSRSRTLRLITRFRWLRIRSRLSDSIQQEQPTDELDKL